MKSIKSKLTVWLIIGVTAIVGLTGLVSYNKNRNQDEAAYQSLRSSLQQRLALSLPQGAWEMDEQYIRLTLDAELSWPSLVAIRTTGDAGLNLGRIRDGAHLRDMSPDETVQADDTMVIPIVYQGKEKLGTATVYLSRSELSAKRRSRLIEIIVQIFIVDLLILIVMSYALRYFVFHPLMELQKALDWVASSKDVQTATLAVNQDNEFGEVIKSFNAIVERIKADLLQLTEAESIAKEEKVKAQLAYQRLLEAQQTLVETEKLASLGGLVAGVAHEVNTPVGITLTTASHLALVTQQINESLKLGAIKKSDFQNYLNTAQESCDLILSNAERAANLIQSFKQVAVDQTSEARRDFELNDYLHEIITSLQPKLRRTRIRVSIECPPEIKMDSFPGALSQVITNLVMNALIHAFDDAKIGKISIHAQHLENDNVSLLIADNGSGIPATYLHRIFEPFFTTKRGSGGSGLGLHIVYNIVRQQLWGTIEVKSTMGEGTSFLIVIPRKAPVPFPKEKKS
jgi:two-component system, NtrC family, sensor kinase